MSTLMRLEQVYSSSDHIIFDNNSKFVFFSDCHRGDSSIADSFSNNSDIFLYALNYYYSNGFTYFELGDGDELWENSRFSDLIKAHLEVYLIMQKFYMDNRLYMIWGNHDIFKSCKVYVRNTLFRYFDSKMQMYRPLFENIKIHEGLILEHSSNLYKIFVVHGHQGEILNDILWPFSCFIVRHFGRLIKIFRYRNLFSQINQTRNMEKMQNIERNMKQWAKRNNIMMIAGYTHKPAFPKPGQIPYFNDGCCVINGYITCIEIQNGEISLVKWFKNTNNLSITKEILSGPEKLSSYFDSISLTQSML